MASREPHRIGQDPDLDEAVRALLLLMPRMVGRVKRIPIPEQLRSLDLSPRHLSMLALMLFDGPMTVNQLASRLEVAPTTVSLMVSELSRKNVLSRFEDDTDRRRRIIDIADAMRPEIETWLANGARAWHQALHPLTPEQRRLFIDTLTAYETALEAGKTSDLSKSSHCPAAGRNDSDKRECRMRPLGPLIAIAATFTPHGVQCHPKRPDDYSDQEPQPEPSRISRRCSATNRHRNERQSQHNSCWISPVERTVNKQSHKRFSMFFKALPHGAVLGKCTQHGDNAAQVRLLTTMLRPCRQKRKGGADESECSDKNLSTYLN